MLSGTFWGRKDQLACFSQKQHWRSSCRGIFSLTAKLGAAWHFSSSVTFLELGGMNDVLLIIAFGVTSLSMKLKNRVCCVVPVGFTIKLRKSSVVGEWNRPSSWVSPVHFFVLPNVFFIWKWLCLNHTENYATAELCHWLHLYQQCCWIRSLSQQKICVFHVLESGIVLLEWGLLKSQQLFK